MKTKWETNGKKMGDPLMNEEYEQAKTNETEQK